jgi:SAM-dependent methyltransferase
MTAEAGVARHYGKGGIEQKILGAMRQVGLDPAKVTAVDLAPVDEFHVGGLEATKELASQMELRPKMHLLDVGCGIGGPARYFSSEYGCKVTGVDLTEEFVQVARSLTRMTKLEGSATFEQASALKLPFEAGSFDGAYMIHVGMNLANKAGVFSEVRRVLKSAGLFAIFDFVRIRDGAILFPVPWSASEESSFVEDGKAYRDGLGAAGFRVDRERDRRASAIEFTEERIAKMAQGDPGAALGLQLLMGEQTPVMIRNILMMMKQGLLGPVEILARAV